MTTENEEKTKKIIKLTEKNNQKIIKNLSKEQELNNLKKNYNDLQGSLNGYKNMLESSFDFYNNLSNTIGTDNVKIKGDINYYNKSSDDFKKHEGQPYYRGRIYGHH